MYEHNIHLMKIATLLYTLITIFVLMLSSGKTIADEIRVAVASNFINTIKSIAENYENSTGQKVTLIFGATGKHYAQIKNGAPFDAFFAADIYRPKLLEDEGVALPGSRFTYAIGKLILWSPKVGFVDSEGKLLKEKNFRHLAIANPKLAPYGKAAQEVLRDRGLWGALKGRMVRGENIGQTFQFVKSGNAELGFVAYSQVKRPGHPVEGSFWEVPQSLYSPIEQQAILLKDKEAARAFLSFMKNDESLDIIRGYGYDTP